MRNRVVAFLQDRLTPLWMRVAVGCRLDHDAVAIVASSGFDIEQVHPHAAGYVVHIVGRS